MTDEQEGSDLLSCVRCDEALESYTNRCGRCGGSYALCMPCSAAEEEALCESCLEDGTTI